MVTLRIQFDKPDKKYKPGQSVRCKVFIVVDNLFKARSLSLRYLGAAHTEWKKFKTFGGRTRSKLHTGDEEYFRQYINFLGPHNGWEKEILPGSYEYEASFILPHNLPSSYEHKIGFIRYSVNLKYDVSWGLDKGHKEIFYVSSDFDLNELTHLNKVVKETEKEIFSCCCCCESDPLDLMNTLPRAGWIPGETMHVSVEMDNHSDIKITCLMFRLLEKNVFTTTSPYIRTKTKWHLLKEFECRTPVAPFQKKVFPIKLYLDPMYNFKILNGCGLILTEYYIQTEAITSGCHTNLKNTTKITIGTKPFSNNLMMNDFTSTGSLIQIMPTYDFNPTIPSNKVISEQPLPSYEDITKNMVEPGFAWNLSPVAESAPLASTEKLDVLDDDNIAPSSFEESVRTGLDKTMNINGAEPSAPALS